MSPGEIIYTATSYSLQTPPESVIRITQAAVTGPYIDPSYMNILSELADSHRGDNQKSQGLVFLLLNSLKPLLQHRESPVLFVLNTLQQAKYNTLNDLPTPAATSSPQFANLTGETPEYIIVTAMLAAGHVSLSSFQDNNDVTLQSLTGDV
jgi:hypothetical protein